MITKTEGAEDQCPSCKQTLVCREITYKDTKKLQWQYKDKEVAHFAYDFKSGKSSCKESAQAGSEAGARANPSNQEQIHIDKIDLPMDQIADINNAAIDGAKRAIVVLSTVTAVCHGSGITHPATIGMIFNQVCEQRRYSGA